MQSGGGVCYNYYVNIMVHDEYGHYFVLCFKKNHGITLPQVIMCFNPVKPVVSHLINEKLPKSFVPSD